MSKVEISDIEITHEERFSCVRFTYNDTQYAEFLNDDGSLCTNIDSNLLSTSTDTFSREEIDDIHAQLETWLKNSGYVHERETVDIDRD